MQRGASVVFLTALLCAATLTVAGDRLATNPFPDSHGYRLYDQHAPQCSFEFIDIESSGEGILFSASGADPADDDGGAVLALMAPFELYGESLTSLVVSSNGYLAAAMALTTEDGGDFSNDLVLPAIPDNLAGIPLRILIYHEELSGFTTGGRAYQQHFATCPRSSEALGTEACTVVQWTDWALRESAATFDMQAVLYHGSFEVVLQLRPGGTPLSGGTTGIQNRQATVALQFSAELPIAADTAACFFDPRFPSGGPAADLEISNADTVDVATPGEPVIYEIGLLNRGPSAALGVAVNNPLPAGLVDCTWSCLSSEGSSCAASGAGPIDHLVDLAPDGWVDYLYTCDTAPVTATVDHVVAATLPPGMSDPYPGNNAAIDVNQVGAGSLPDMLTLDRDVAGVSLSWSASCLASDGDFAVYAGTLGRFGTHAPATCTTNGALGQLLPIPNDDTYYLIVPTNSFNEGSYGPTGTEQERSPSSSPCYPQALGNCPEN